MPSKPFFSKSKIKSLQVRIREFKKMKSPKSGLEDARTADRQFQADKEWDSLRDSTHATHRPLRKVGGVGETDEGDKESKSSSANSTAEGSLSSGTPDAANVFKYARPLSPVPEDSVEETLAQVRSRLRATAEARGERNKGEAEGNGEAISDSGAARPVNTIRGRDVVDSRIPSMSSSWLEHKRVERLLKVVELENLLQAQAIRLVRLIHAENHPAKVHFDVYTATASVLRSIEQPGSPVNKQRVIAKGHYVSMATVIPDPTTGVWHIIKRGTGCFPSRWKSLETFIHELREDLEIRAVMPDKRLPKLTDKPWADGEDRGSATDRSSGESPKSSSKRSSKDSAEKLSDAGEQAARTARNDADVSTHHGLFHRHQDQSNEVGE